jgi:AcrR family transcriptional regulator
MAKATTSKPTGRATRANLADRILETALAQAEEESWGAVRLRKVAGALNIPLADVLDHYRDLDAVANAWFRRAWTAMLQPPPGGFAEQPARERIEIVMMRWFDALAPHRRVTGQMLAAKMWCAHPHHWVPAIFNLSRTIQWVREAAMLDATGRRRQMEEIGLTALFLATLRMWLRDETDGQERTGVFLRRRLADADRLLAAVQVRRRPEESPAADAATGQG